ncbi:hypothetical protein [Streptomyces sp. NPDC059378]|uniref:hypothetical protein n=1 Tax=Streptomyces sp. NPDC059378 TaxID=3346815 RepID=UPI0036ADBAC0
MSDVLTPKGRELTSGPHAPGQFADAVTGADAGRALVQFEGQDHALNLKLSLSLFSSRGPVVSVVTERAGSFSGIQTFSPSGR